MEENEPQVSEETADEQKQEESSGESALGGAARVTALPAMPGRTWVSTVRAIS